METDYTVSGLDLWQWRNQARQQATVAGVPVTEVDWLLQEMADLDRLSLRLESFQTRKAIPLRRSLSDLTQLWHQRIHERVPVQHLAGVTPWRQFSLRVSADVLIPRPETEYLIDLAKQAASQDVSLAKGHWADLGTGSGAIALGLADAFPDAVIHAVDCSPKALAIAQENARRTHFDHRIQFHQGVWFQPLSQLQGQLSGMVSNPPYIPTSMLPDLQPEVACHEPLLALDGGADGLNCIRLLVKTAPSYLRSGGVWLVEMMAGQAEAVMELLQAQGCYSKIDIHTDLAGLERFALAYRQ